MMPYIYGEEVISSNFVQGTIIGMFRTSKGDILYVVESTGGLIYHFQPKMLKPVKTYRERFFQKRELHR